MEILLDIILYGCLGWIVEILFTGFHSLIVKNWRATAQTYLWMFPIYGLGAMALKAINASIVLHEKFFINAVLMSFCFYVPMIYGFEFLSGWLLQKISGRVPWTYGPGKFTIMGLIRLDYAPFWFGLALIFQFLVGPLGILINKILQ